MDCEQLCTCFFCLSPIRTYMVQVQNQAQEQELFPPVKWVWVKCINGHHGASKTKKNDNNNNNNNKKKKAAGFVQAGQLSLNFHIFSFPCLSHSVLALQLFMNNCRLLETWVCQSNSPSWQHGVLTVHVEIACHQPLLLNVGSAWDTQLFLYIRITSEIGIALAQQQLQQQRPTIPYLFKH